MHTIIKDSFLEPEVREGFYVPSEVKQAWAAELEVLQEIDRICKKYDIAYFADWGTLLGVVRHGGFIPWDDDLDITMKRADYERFLQVAEQEMKEEYAIFTYATHPDFWSFLARFVAKNKICFEEEHLNKFHGFPYIVGIDIFVLDYVSMDKEKEEERCVWARYVIGVADAIAEGRLTGREAEQALNKIENTLAVTLYDKKNLHSLRVQLYRLAEKLFAMFSEEESKELTRMMPNGLYHSGNFQLSKEYYEKQIFLPFETILMPVPSGYDEMLRKRYGNYMKSVRNTGGHDYPFFETQRKELQAVLDFEMPGYRYRGIVSRNAERGRRNSLKSILAQGYEKLCASLELLTNELETAAGMPNIEHFAEGQQIAIEIGTLIDSCKGEGHPTVHVLENYCEALYALSQNPKKEFLNRLQNLLEELDVSMQTHIFNRTTAVFLPCKASEWKYMQSVWQAAKADETCDVYVIPIPYYYKGYAGVLQNMQYEAAQFPENLQVISYQDFDFELQYPDRIFIQNPYDEFDTVISVHNFFYSTNLKQYTRQLIYIPPFILEEFTKDNYREYHNMKYYCTVPGVVNADKVFVQSENMKQLYVQKLMEFAGEDTKEIWEEKIIGLAASKEALQTTLQEKEKKLPIGWNGFVKKSNGSLKKIILYYVGVSSFIQYKEQMLEKMQEVFRVFEENKAEVVMLWKVHSILPETLKQTDETIYETFCRLEQEYRKNTWGILADTETDEQLVEYCDAYYGDSSPLAQRCVCAGKAVMIQNI